MMLIATFISAKAQIMSLDEVSTDKAYTIYNPHYTSYAVYNAKESSGLVWAAGMTLGANPDREIADESYKLAPDLAEPSSSWMIVQYEGNWYVYNIGAQKFLSLGNRDYNDVAARLQDQPYAVKFIQASTGGFHIYRFDGETNFLCLAPQLQYPITLWTKEDNGSTWEIKENPLVTADYEACLQKLKNGVTFAQEIVTRADVALSFINDEVYPWTIGAGEAKNGNTGIQNSSSILSFSYSSDVRTELSFDWACYNYSAHTLKLYIDGVYKDFTTSSSYSNKKIFLEAGNHVITFKDTIAYTYQDRDWSKIKNINVKNIQPLETYILTDKSQPLTFTNDGEWPWTIEDGYIQNGNSGNPNSVSKFSTTFTVTEPSKFSFTSSTYYYNGGTTYEYGDYQRFDFIINGERYMGREYGSSTTSILLTPGNYTMEWSDSIYDTTADLKSRIYNIELSSDWLNVELATAGSLGVEVLYKVDVLTDVELLKVKGNLNSTDWTNLKQMKNLLGLDLSEAQFDAVPDYAFDGLSSLSNVKLPDGVKTIGEYAFRGTQILNIDIPASVTSIGKYAFASTRVASVNFTEDSKLQTIGYRAFYNCSSLREFIMPNTVTKLGVYNNYDEVDDDCSTFSECINLKKLHFSNSLTSLEQYVCYQCYNLEEVVLPANLQYIRDYAFYGNDALRHIDIPESVSRIDYYAFRVCGLDSVILPLRLSYIEERAFERCSNLKYIELPSYIGNYNENFRECYAIEKIVCKSATPPAIARDPFINGRAKSDITLVVPSFAVVNYKLDTYWYQFGSIIEGDDIDYWKISGALSLTNNRRMNGKPDIDLYDGGKLTVGGAAPMETGLFNYFPYFANPACLLNDCPSMTADSINTYYGVDGNKWYFFTPVHDVDVSKISVNNDASYVIRYYDGQSRATNGVGNSWRNVDTDKLLAGQGYIFQSNTYCVLTLPCEADSHHQMFTTTDVTTQLNVYESAASANKSWNYIGNPYPSYYDIYYMDFTAPITVWTGSTYKAYSIADDNFVLSPMQSFFVQKPDEIDNIVFHKEGRQLTSEIQRPSYLKARTKEIATTRLFFDLQIQNDGEMIDETRVVINESAKLDYEVVSDASKFMSIKEDVPQIFSIDIKGNQYAINERPISDSIVNLGYRVSAAGYYTITATRVDGEVVLYDKKTGKTVDLSSQDYYFYSEATEGNDNTRFVLKLNTNNSNLTGVDVVSFQNITVKGTEGCMEISCGDNSRISVYTSDGLRIYEEVSTGGNTRINIPKGVYIVRVNDSIFKTVVL